MTSKDSNPFRPTHVITHQGEEILVQEDDRALYTEDEWNSYSPSDWSFSRSGTLLFQGQVPAGEHSFQRIDR